VRRSEGGAKLIREGRVCPKVSVQTWKRNRSEGEEIDFGSYDVSLVIGVWMVYMI
jgi:hypothetical protein